MSGFQNYGGENPFSLVNSKRGIVQLEAAVLLMSDPSAFTLGAIAAATAPAFMTIGFIVWENNWYGSAFSLNLFKCNLASVGFVVASLAARKWGDQPFSGPGAEIQGDDIGYLVLSSVIGILIGDFLWLEGLRLLGARRVIVVDTVKPALAALMGWALLGEELRITALAGVALTACGVLVVGMEREEKPEGAASGSLREKRTDSAASLRRGYVASAANACLDTYGSVLTKQHGMNMTVWEISLVRFGFAGLAMLALSMVMAARARILDGRKVPAVEVFPEMQTEVHAVPVADGERDPLLGCADGPEDGRHVEGGGCPLLPPPWYALPSNMTRRSWTHMVAGVVCVTFLTPALSNYALFRTPLALTLTLTSVGPMYALPLSWGLQGDRPTWRACLGAAVAMAGTVVLGLFGKVDSE